MHAAVSGAFQVVYPRGLWSRPSGAVRVLTGLVNSLHIVHLHSESLQGHVLKLFEAIWYAYGTMAAAGARRDQGIIVPAYISCPGPVPHMAHLTASLPHQRIASHRPACP